MSISFLHVPSVSAFQIKNLQSYHHHHHHHHLGQYFLYCQIQPPLIYNRRGLSRRCSTQNQPELSSSNNPNEEEESTSNNVVDVDLCDTEMDSSNSQQDPEQEHHANIYQQWTVEDDKLLWEYYDQQSLSVVEIASLLGRGIHGVTSRISKLGNVNSSAYERLFVLHMGSDGSSSSSSSTSTEPKTKKKNKNKNKKKGKKKHNDDDNNDDNDATTTASKKKLVPITEVLRRIEWDTTLPTDYFYIRYYDRVDDTIQQVSFSEPNTSIDGPATSFIKALPEHRIVSVLYKERIVWDRPTKLDLVFGGSSNNNSNNENDDSATTTRSSTGKQDITYIIETYPQWEEEQRLIRQQQEERKHYIEYTMTRMLGLERFTKLNQLVQDLITANADPTTSTKQHIEQTFVPQSLSLLSNFRNNVEAINNHSMDPSLIPQSDWKALDMLSEYVSSTFDDTELRSQVLWEIFYTMDQMDGGEKLSSSSSSSSSSLQNIILNEDELDESFVRGSGPGGQKINKTSNRVILIHIPTQLRVECQDTRSLQQNRKLARKRLVVKLDEHINGRQSKTQMAHQKASNKRQRSKSKNRARHRKKALEKQLEQLEQQQRDGEQEEEIW